MAADPSSAREQAALWERSGGGVAARLCEAEALAAMGAHGSAALLLTRLAENPNRAMGADLRAVVLGDAAAQWLADGRPDLARAVLDQADQIAEQDRERRVLRARAAAAMGDWPAAEAPLRDVLAADPDDARARALLAASLRQQGDVAAGRAEAERALAQAPDLPEALFEAAAGAAETGDTERAATLWLALIRVAPDSDLAASARVNLQRLQ